VYIIRSILHDIGGNCVNHPKLEARHRLCHISSDCGIAGFIKGLKGNKKQKIMALSAAYSGFLKNVPSSNPRKARILMA
jgi:CRISPR/Cas system-associated protein Cas10 (large subunit of type III CRISPR-Cas system)